MRHLVIPVRTSPSGPLLKQWYWPYVLVGPAVILIILCAFFPIIWGILLSLQPDSLASRGQFVLHELTITHYVNAFKDPVLWKSIWVTLTYNASATFSIVLISILGAMSLSHVGRSAGFFQSLLIVPICVAQPVVIIIWRTILHPRSGIVNGILSAIGLPLQGFYESAGQALWVLVFLALWSGLGFWTMVFSAALRNISRDIIEASIIDGASGFRRFRSIIIPLLRRTLLLACVVLSIHHFVVFVPSYLLTYGGPNDMTRFLMYLAGMRLIKYGLPGQANAGVVIILVMMFIVVGLQFRLLRSEHD